MKLLACLLLLTSPGSLELFDETATIARGNWNFYQVNLRQRPATVEAAFDVLSGARQVRLVLMTHDEAQRMHAGEAHRELAATAAGARGSLSFTVARPDDYALVVDNRAGSESAAVRVRASLDFARAKRVPWERQAVVIALSFAFFFGVVTFSARRVMRAMRRG